MFGSWNIFCNRCWASRSGSFSFFSIAASIALCGALSSAQLLLFRVQVVRTNSDDGGDIWLGGCSWLQIQLESLHWHLGLPS